MGDWGNTPVAVPPGVGGPEDDGDSVSTTHILWLRVATSLATVWANVQYGLTWKTGKESLPSWTPLSERMTEVKWMQEDRRRGREVDLVSNCRIVSREDVPMVQG